MGDSLPLSVEFTGGLEMLFSNQRTHSIHLPAQNETGQPADIAFLVRHLCKEVMTDRRQEMFVLDHTVRPGILVLINEADWELEGGADYVLRPRDQVLFVSTLHGG
ncbi:MAG: Ubiquitin- modifier 1 [Caeruleum heppii]|nr:MAG: Ubiquitin- modifier 1 [Caeruleum heppii]